MITPVEQAGRRAERIGGETRMIEALGAIELLQTIAVLDDAFSLRGMISKKSHLGFKIVQEAERADYRHAE